MNVLILGSGGREHALAWKISQSKLLNKLFIAPGNAGTKSLGENINMSINNFEEIKEFVLDNKINMVIVGPEEPLVKGIVNFFAEDALLKSVLVIGPDREAAMLEGSKEFAKKFMEKYKIPTAAYKCFYSDSYNEACDFLDTLKAPYVLKADGLAAGKGVLIIDNLEQAKESLRIMLGGQFGEASKKVVIEEFLDGIEVSFFAITDGDNYVLLPEAKDYKRIGENNTGLNTGGMGAVSPVSFVDDTFKQKVVNDVIEPTIKGIKSEGFNYKGFVFFGLINVKGEPKVIEYNVRMGDPETEVVIPRVESDLLELFKMVENQDIVNCDFKVKKDSAATVMMVSEGYPEYYEKEKEIKGLEEVVSSLVFHAGTKIKNNKTVSSGGRVVSVTSYGKDMNEALEKSYESVKKIQFDKAYYRKDIGFDL